MERLADPGAGAMMNPFQHISQRGLDNLALIAAATVGVNITLLVGWALFG